ncbi:MAG: hypothetical protein ACLR71_19240 [[Clostridium] scindens]
MNIDEEGKRKLKKAISLMDKVYELEGEEKAELNLAMPILNSIRLFLKSQEIPRC